MTDRKRWNLARVGVALRAAIAQLVASVLLIGLAQLSPGRSGAPARA